MRNPTLTKALSAYASANSAALPPVVAVVRLYETATAHLHQARDAARDGRFDAHFQAMDRAITILLGLDSILKLDKGGDVAATLRRFYRSLVRQAGLAAARRDPVAATEAIIRQLSFMTKAWQTIAAERGVVPSPTGASAKGSHASVIGRSMDHARGGLFG
ncbi:flagellar export chaperone FliS [Azospirillum sp. Marseille-Q6669]